MLWSLICSTISFLGILVKDMSSFLAASFASLSADAVLTSNQEPSPKTLAWKEMEIVVFCGIRIPQETPIEKMEPTTEIKSICMGTLPNSTDLPYDFTNHKGEICKVGWLMDV
jgi:hypothetical protein